MHGSTTVVIGGGFGGIATARLLRASLPAEHEIRLLSKSRTFQIGATKTWVMLGEVDEGAVTRSLDALPPLGIEVLFTEASRIDPSSRAVSTPDGELEADYVVVATGAELDMESVPGLSGAAETFYTREGASRLRKILGRFDGGRVVVLIPRIPFQCPPGPYEAAMLLHAWLERRGLRDRTSIDIHTVEKAPMTTAGPGIGRAIVERLDERRIGFHPQCQVEHVDAARKRCRMTDGTEVAFDLLIAVPPHLGGRAVRESGLTNPAGWVPVDPRTLELAATPAPHRIFAIGDVCSVPLPGRFSADAPLVLPKAGVFAERQAAIVAGRIAAHALGREPAGAFDGRGFCFIELGGGVAMRGDGSFFDLPHPTMAAREPDAAQLAEKRSWVDNWLATYL